MFKSKVINGRANHIELVLLICMFLIVFLKSDAYPQYLMSLCQDLTLSMSDSIVDTMKEEISMAERHNDFRAFEGNINSCMLSPTAYTLNKGEWLLEICPLNWEFIFLISRPPGDLEYIDVSGHYSYLTFLAAIAGLVKLEYGVSNNLQISTFPIIDLDGFIIMSVKYRVLNELDGNPLSLSFDITLFPSSSVNIRCTLSKSFARDPDREGLNVHLSSQLFGYRMFYPSDDMRICLKETDLGFDYYITERMRFVASLRYPHKIHHPFGISFPYFIGGGLQLKVRENLALGVGIFYFCRQKAIFPHIDLVFKFGGSK